MMNKSPHRNIWLKEKYLTRAAQEGRTPDNDPEVAAMVELYDSWASRDQENDLEWQKNNLEYDLRSNPYIAEKCKQDYYAQNLYAALCNNDFIKNDIWPLLKGEKWSCSWRYAGGIIADIRQEGDYIDWYCSGIKDSFHKDDLLIDLTEEQRARIEIAKLYVGEGFVTDEIRNDLLKLGWLVVEDNLGD